ncbi:MAG: hypothetical protein ACI30I_05680 [Parabacteroides sp.]
MRTIYTFLFSALMLLAFTACQSKGDQLLLGGSGWNKIVIVDKNTKNIIWEHPLEKGWECNSVARTADGNILFSYSKGAKLITPEHEELWNIPAPEGCEMQTARILPDGRFLLAWCGSPACILEVSKEGEILSKTEYETGIEHSHAQFRQVNKHKNGNYLLPLFATHDIREVTPQGELVKSTEVGGTPFSVAAMPNGHYLVACGDGHYYLELNYETGEVVRKVDVKDIEGAQLFFVAQLWPTSKGGAYICNWQGHDGDAALLHCPQLLEVDASGKMVWSLNDNQTFGMISTICPF